MNRAIYTEEAMLYRFGPNEWGCLMDHRIYGPAPMPTADTWQAWFDILATE